MSELSRRWIYLLVTMLTLSCALASVSRAAENRPESSEMTALLMERGCYACHALTETLIGPSYHAIAELHQARKDLMLEVLARKIIVGGAGNWGLVPMVPNEHVSEDEAREMAAWILNLSGPGSP